MDWYIVVDVLEKVAAFIFSVSAVQAGSVRTAQTLKVNAAASSEMSVSIYQ